MSIFTTYAASKNGLAFEEAFAEQFGEAPPEDLNTNQVFTIVAASVDGATERIVRFLNEGYGVPINVVFFRHFVDGESAYLARTWLVDKEQQVATTRSAPRQRNSQEPWNGQDWYVSFGEDVEGRRWDDAREYGFVSAGGNKWYSRTLKNLPVGARVFACVPKAGYVGVGVVVESARRFDQSYVTLVKDDVMTRLEELPLLGTYRRAGDDDDDVAEWVVAVDWQRTVPVTEAVWKTGMFANQNSAARLRQQFTIEQVTAAFDIED